MRHRALLTSLAGLVLAVGAVMATGTTPAAAAGVADIRINEIESSPTGQGSDVRDWVELANTGAASVDASGLVLRGTENRTGAGFVLPAGSTLAPGARRAFDVDVDVAGGFQLRDADTLRLLSADETATLDTYSWTTAASTTWGRCPEGTGAFTTTTQPTKGTANACPATPTPTPTPTPSPPVTPSPVVKDTTPPQATVSGVRNAKVYRGKPPVVTCEVTDASTSPDCQVTLELKRLVGQRKLVVQALVRAIDAAGNQATARTRFATAARSTPLPEVKDLQPATLITVTGVKAGKTYATPPTPGCTTVGNTSVESCSVQLFNVLAQASAAKREVLKVLAVVRGYSADGSVVDTATRTFTTRVP